MALALDHGVRFDRGDMMRRQLAGFALAVTLTGCGVSTQQEIEMGQQYASQINQQLPIVSDPEANRYINLLGDSIARLTSRTDIPDWHFYIVDSKEVNAFAVPGGFVYVNRGLIERTQRMDQLAGVLGHEIGHVVRRHSIKQMQQQQGANIGVTLACVLTRICDNQAGQAAIQVGGTALFAKFSRTDEAEADAEGIKNVVRAGISPNGIPEMFQILINERQSNPSAVEGWFATHPMEEDRIASTRAQIAKISPSILRTLSTDSQRYQSFKSRIRSLPPSPTPRARASR
jgi:predicted Zn-dependent protease